MRFVVSVVVSGIVLYLCGTVSHVVLNWHHDQVSGFTDEAAVGKALSANAPEPGIYMIPWVEKDASSEEMEANLKRMGDGPFVFAIVRSGSQPVNFGRNLGLQFATSVLVALCLCLMIQLAGRPALGRAVALTGLAGLAAGLLIHAPYLVWFEFPSVWTWGSIADGAISTAVTGVPIAMILKPTAPPTA